MTECRDRSRTRSGDLASDGGGSGLRGGGGGLGRRLRERRRETECAEWVEGLCARGESGRTCVGIVELWASCRRTVSESYATRHAVRERRTRLFGHPALLHVFLGKVFHSLADVDLLLSYLGLPRPALPLPLVQLFLCCKCPSSALLRRLVARRTGGRQRRRSERHRRWRELTHRRRRGACRLLRGLGTKPSCRC